MNLKAVDFILETSDGRLQARHLNDSKFGIVYVDFVTGKTAHRRVFGSAPREAITKAVGWVKGLDLYVVDATAGFGQDAFVLASAGCHVHMLERVPMVASLLKDGLERAKEDAEIGDWVSLRLSMSHQDTIEGFEGLPFQPDVVYIDVMFPEKKKASLVKKEMQFLQAIVGEDTDADVLFELAFKVAKKRVVVKRPLRAENLGGHKPNVSIKCKNYRFDIYLV